MNSLIVNTEFNDFQSVLTAKKAYEDATNTILVVGSSKKIIGESELSKALIYERICYECKAGCERPSASNGIRASATYKKGCPVKVSLIFKFKLHSSYQVYFGICKKF